MCEWPKCCQQSKGRIRHFSGCWITFQMYLSFSTDSSGAQSNEASVLHASPKGVWGRNSGLHDLWQRSTKQARLHSLEQLSHGALGSLATWSLPTNTRGLGPGPKASVANCFISPVLQAVGLHIPFPPGRSKWSSPSRDQEQLSCVNLQQWSWVYGPGWLFQSYYCPVH